MRDLKTITDNEIKVIEDAILKEVINLEDYTKLERLKTLAEQYRKQLGIIKPKSVSYKGVF